MISTLAQVKDRALARLDDPAQGTFKNAILLPGIQEALDVMQEALVLYEVPRSKVVITATVPAGTTSITPAAMGIADLGEIIEIRERRLGSTDKFVHVSERDDLTQRDATDSLGEWEWRSDTVYFIGATTARELWVSYFSTSTQPSEISGSSGVDGALNFLSLYTVGAVGKRKGYDEIADECMNLAVGPAFDRGVIGGALFRLIQVMVRSRQRVQVAPKPYSVVRRTMTRRPPYIAAQQPQGVGLAPVQFSYSAGTITGTLDGTNATFYLAYPVASVVVVLNGATLTPTLHYAHGANVVTFVAPFIPQPGADILVQGWQ